MKNAKISLLILLLSIFYSNAFTQNLVITGNTATFWGDTTIGLTFYVPNAWDTIVIKENVTVTGNFVTPDERTKDITVRGEDWNTSVLKGTGNVMPYENNVLNRRLATAISNNGKGTLFVENLKSYNPDKFHLRSEGRIIVNHCNIVQDAGLGHADGVHGGRRSKSEVHDSYISTWDDATYLSECWLITNTTIVMNGNGAAFQVGYGNNYVHEDYTCEVINCTVVGNGDKYSKGVVAWTKNTYNSGPNHAKIYFENFTLINNPGKLPLKMYTVGGNNGKTVGSNCEIHVTGDNSICDLNTYEFRSNSPGIVRVFDCNTEYTRDGISGTHTITADHSIKIYPNPATDYLNISGILPATIIKIYNISGTLALQSTNNERINISQLENGTYFLKVGSEITKIFMKE